MTALEWSNLQRFSAEKSTEINRINGCNRAAIQTINWSQKPVSLWAICHTWTTFSARTQARHPACAESGKVRLLSITFADVSLDLYI
jgi:hypothetical protein